jgi:hypothetical protein
MSISQQDINMLNNEGHTIIESSLEQGYIVVSDYVLCMSGGKRWTEEKQLRLTTHKQVLQYIIDRD